MARIIRRLPGAREAGAIDFVDRYLSGIGFIYAKPDGSGFETLTGRRADAWRQRIDDIARDHTSGHRGARRVWRNKLRSEFHRARTSSQQDDALDGAGARRFAERIRRRGAGRGPALQQTLTETELEFLPLLVMHTRQGFYADPIYGGNKDRVGWRAIGFPGPASLMEVYTGRYSTLQWFAQGEAEKYRGGQPWRLRRSPRARTSASSAPARRARPPPRCLTEGGMSVVGLERGPWRRRETFGGDELANINRYNLWPDPLLNPRTTRAEGTKRRASRISARCRRWSAAAPCIGRAGCRASRRRIFACARSPAN